MGQSPPSSTYNQNGDGLPFFQGKAEFGDLSPTPRVWCSHPGKVAEADDVLLSVRAPVGPTNLAPTKCCIGRGLAAIRPESGIHLKYLLHAFRRFAAQLDAQGTGTTFKAVSGKVVRDFPFLVPPIAEQFRIADTLDELLSDLDAGVAGLERVREKLKLYRATVLKAAMEGALTADWRKQHSATEHASELLRRILAERRLSWENEQLRKFTEKGRPPPSNWKRSYKEPKRPDLKTAWETPTTWTWTGFEELADGSAHALKAGPFGSALKKEFYTPAGYKIYGQEQVIRGDPYFGDYFIGEERFTKLRSCAVKPGDVLISLVGTAGKVLVLPEDSQAGIINPRLLKVTLSPGNVDARYVKLVLESPQARQFFKLRAHGGTMEILNLGILKEFPIPLPPLEEQWAILDEVDDHVSIIDHLEADLGGKLRSAKALRQSILRHAFAGRLAPQDPADEPASDLLKRIATERATRDRKPAAARRPARKFRRRRSVRTLRGSGNTKQRGN